MKLSDLNVNLFDVGILTICEGSANVEKKQFLKSVCNKEGLLSQVLFLNQNNDILRYIVTGVVDGKAYCEEVVLEKPIEKTSEEIHNVTNWTNYGRHVLPADFPRPTEKELNDFREFIRRHNWKSSTTMANFCPHQYIVDFPCWKMKEDGKCSGFCDSCKKRRKEFEKWVLFIRKYGERQKMLKTVYTVLCVDDKQYWSMGDPMNTTWILNRALIEDPNRVPKIYWLDRI